MAINEEILKLIPEESREKITDMTKEAKYMENIKDVTDLVTQFSNAQELLGKKAIIPEEGSKDYGKFLESLRPKSETEYEINDIEGFDKSKLAKDMFESNLSREQAKNFTEKLNNYISEKNKSEQEKAQKEIDELSNSLFSKKPDEALDKFGEVEGLLDKGVKDNLEKLSGEAKLVLLRQLEHVKKEYMNESPAPPSGEPPRAPNIEEKKEQLRKIRSHEGFKNRAQP